MVSIKDKDDIFSLLVCLGYLGCIEKRNGLKSAYVPNQEIKQTLLSIVKGQKWSKRTTIVKRSEDLLKAIIKQQDGEKVAEIIYIFETELFRDLPDVQFRLGKE